MRRSHLSSLTLALLLCGCGSQLQSDFGSQSPGVAPLNSFVDPTATLTGTVKLGPGVYVAPFARIQAGVSKVEIGALSDVQDNATVMADTTAKSPWETRSSWPTAVRSSARPVLAPWRVSRPLWASMPGWRDRRLSPERCWRSEPDWGQG